MHCKSPSIMGARARYEVNISLTTRIQGEASDLLERQAPFAWRLYYGRWVVSEFDLRELDPERRGNRQPTRTTFV